VDKPLFLRLEKRGRQVLGFVSEDGKKWEPLTPKDLPEGWPEDAKVGVAAISTSWGEFKPQFTGLKVEQGSALKEDGK
jgi:regulation of enolase protein 1 (concanavalin A-like superfamily)